MHLERKKAGKDQTFAHHTHTQPISEKKMARNISPRTYGKREG